MTNIIIEGADATGKSTLARHLSKVFHMNLQESEGPPQSYQELEQRIDRYATLQNTIFVRHPAISNPIYDKIRQLDGKSPTGTPDRQIPRDWLIIYCHPLWSTLDGHHTVNANDTQEHLAQINTNYDALCNLYEEWAKYGAHLFYKIGNDIHRLTQVIAAYQFDPVRDLVLFHEKFDLTYHGMPRFLPQEFVEFRQQFLLEELTEYTASHLGHPEVFADSYLRQSLAFQIDALVDLVYVALGNAYLQGFDFRESWRRVHAANMTKIRASNAGQSLRNSTFDVIKGPDFVPPSHTDLVQNHAYRDLDDSTL